MALDVIEIETSDGHRSRLRMHGSRPGAPGLLWLAALGVPAEKYDAFGQSLARAGVHCAVHEWRGIGSSSLRAARGSDWNYQSLLEHDIPASRAALDPSVRWCVGGHSLGGQFAAMAAARSPQDYAGIVLLATGVPYAPLFSGRVRFAAGTLARFMRPLTAAAGYFPGQRLRFAGREASGVMRDWAQTVRTGHYLAYGAAETMDSALSRLGLPALGVRFTQDWLVPEASMAALLAKLGGGVQARALFDEAGLGARPDHFRWMRSPDAVADRIAAWMPVSP